MPDRGSPIVTSESIPYREMIDGDPDRGVALFDSQLRLVYANLAARGVLHDQEGHLAAALNDALTAFRDRLERSDAAHPPPELHLGTEAGRRMRATLTPIAKADGRGFLVRLSPPGLFAEPTMRNLQTRFRLTLREAQVALSVSKGATNAETAKGLGITEKTVKNALMAVFTKCKVRNRVEMALRAHDALAGGDRR